MNKLNRNCLLKGLLLAAASAGALIFTMAGARAAQDSSRPVRRAEEERCPLANGVYAVLSEALTRKPAQPGEAPQLVCIYDQKYSEFDKDEPPKYIALDRSSFVPLILAGPPETEKDDRGWTLLRLTLAREHVTTLEEFTRTHLNGRVAIVIGGEIVTMHKIRTVIQDGRAQITRCTDDACEILRLKLTK